MFVVAGRGRHSIMVISLPLRCNPLDQYSPPCAVLCLCPSPSLTSLCFLEMFRIILSSRALPPIPRYAPRTIGFARSIMTSGAKNDDLKVDKLFNVADLTAVVSGGGTGIGLMITQGLVSNGAKVFITGRRQEALEKVKERYSGPGEIIPYVIRERLDRAC